MAVRSTDFNWTNTGIEYGAPDALDAWFIAARGAGIKHVMLLGDSIVQGVGATGTSWADQLRTSLQTTQFLGDGGGGFMPAWRCTEAGSWATVATTDFADDGLFNYVRATSGSATDIQTWTKPAGMTVNSFDIYFVAGPFTVPFAYSVDGGAWTNIAAFTTNTGLINKQTIATAVSTSIRIRGANAAGTAGLVYFVGFGVNTSTANAVRIHNVGKASDFLASVDRSTTGDPYAMFDFIAPDLAILGPFSNDLFLSTSLSVPIATSRALFKQDMLNLVAELQGKGSSVLIVKVFEQDRGNCSPSDQAEYRLVIDEVVDETGVASIDFFTLWGNIANWTALGYSTDGTHPNQAGHDAMATAIIDATSIQHSVAWPLSSGSWTHVTEKGTFSAGPTTSILGNLGHEAVTPLGDYPARRHIADTTYLPHSTTIRATVTHSATVATLISGLFLKASDTTASADYYIARQVGPGDGKTGVTTGFAIEKRVGGSYTRLVIDTDVTGVTPGTGPDTMAFRAVERAGDVLLQAKIWATGGSEPAWPDITWTGTPTANPADGVLQAVDSQSGLWNIGGTVGTWEAQIWPGIQYVAARGFLQNRTAGTTSLVDLPTGGSISAATTNNYLIARVAVDNAGTNGAAPGLTITDPRGNTWTVSTASNSDPGAANAGVTCYIARCRVANGYVNGDDITFTWGVSVTAKAITIEEYTGVHVTTPIAVAAANANGANGQATASLTPTAAGQMMVISAAVEGPDSDTYTEDTDTTNGPWVSSNRYGTTNATADLNVKVFGAQKLVTASGAQVWTPTTTSRDWATCAYALGPLAGIPQYTDWENFNAQDFNDQGVMTSAEVETAQTLFASHDLIVDKANEVEVVQDLTIEHVAGVTNIDLVPAAEVTTAQTIIQTRDISLARASEVETALVLPQTRDILLGRASEVDTAATLVQERSILLGLAAEVENAKILTTTTDITLVPAPEADTAKALLTTTDILLTPTTEIETAQVLDAVAENVVILGFAEENNIVAALVVDIDVNLFYSPAVEAETAQTLVVFHEVLLVPATEAETAKTLLTTTDITLVRAAEVETAEVLLTTTDIQLSVATETDTAKILKVEQEVLLVPAVELDTASQLHGLGELEIVLTPAVEAELAQPVVAGVDVILETVFEHEIVQELELRPVLDVLLVPAIEQETASIIIVTFGLGTDVFLDPALEIETAQIATLRLAHPLDLQGLRFELLDPTHAALLRQVQHAVVIPPVHAQVLVSSEVG